MCGMKLLIHSQTSTVEWISNFITHFTGHVITYPSRIKIKPAQQKGPQDIIHDSIDLVLPE